MMRDARLTELLQEPMAITAEGMARLLSGRAPTSEQLQARRRELQQAAPAAVTVIPIHGVITQRQSYYGTSIDEIVDDVSAALGDSRVREMVLHVDSPGGSVYGVAEGAAVIRAAREQKFVTAVADSEMYSAAYHLGSAANRLVITPSGGVGSIGVWSAHEDYSGYLEQAGIKVTLVSAGKGKTDGNPFEPLGDEALAEMQKSVDGYYRGFVADVAKARGVPPKTVQQEWQAKLYMAKEAVTLGLADTVGTFASVLHGSRQGSAARRTAEVIQRRRART